MPFDSTPFEHASLENQKNGQTVLAVKAPFEMFFFKKYGNVQTGWQLKHHLKCPELSRNLI